ncbi:MAG: energy transducer TonB [Gammaproteobacteria bacterium]|nr:energy transducer TonB [Gammaproteobacteria bacterium]
MKLVRTLTVVVVLVGLGGCLTSPNRPLQLISGTGPAYPAAAQAQGVEGYVVVRYDVTVQGRVSKARVVRAEPEGVFDEAALGAVRSWVFNPPLVDGEPQSAVGRESTVTFKVGSGDEYADY